MSIFLIFIIISGITVLGIVAEIIRQRRCLTEDEFALFRSSRMRKNDKRYRRAISHLGICGKCQRKLEELNFGRDLSEHLVDKR